MNRVRSIQHLIILQYLYLFAICQSEDPNGWPSLILTETNGQFEFTIPISYDYKTKTAHFKTPEQRKTYRFCPYSNVDPIYLIEMKQFEYAKDITDTEELCTDRINALLIKVKNPAEFKKIPWNQQEMELYHSGFLLRNNFMKAVANKCSIQTTKPDYGNPVSIEFYYNKIINWTVATQYKLLAVNFLFIRNTAFHKFEDEFKKIHSAPTPPLFTFLDSPRYLEQFQGTITSEWMQILLAQSERNPLSLLEFASCEHFALPLWTMSCRFNLNHIPIWKIAKLMWLRVEIFARIVAQYLDDLHVTAGITQTMTLSNKELIDINGFRMPKYFWKIFEYANDGKVYGIIVVLNCNVFEKTEKKICESVIRCEEHGWMIENDDYKKGEIYCCEMTAGNIEKLDANFLSLKSRENFNLFKWIPESVMIQNEYELINSRKQYQMNFE